MESLLPTTSAGITATDHGCPFFDKLPLEIREEVYGYLLGAKYTKTEHNMKSSDYNDYRPLTLEGPDHTYQYFPVILAVNGQMRAEAGALFRRENTFVRFVFGQYWHRIFWEHHGDVEFASIAHGEEAWDFPIAAMTLCLGSPDNGDRRSDTEPPAVWILHISDLATFCANLLFQTRHREPEILAMPLLITVEEGVGSFPSVGSHDARLPQLKAEQLLEPLRLLHGFESVEIVGPITPSYKADVIADICSHRPSPKEIIEQGLACIDEGDRIYSTGELDLAMATYKRGLTLIRGSIFNLLERDEMIRIDDSSVFVAKQVRVDIIVRLHARIANLYHETKRYRMARIYTERIYRPLHSWDDGNFAKLPLDLDLENGACPESYAEVLAVAARVSFVHGNFEEACSEISEAIDLDPWNNEYKEQLEVYETELQRITERREHRERAKQVKVQRIVDKIALELKVAAHREEKANRLTRIGDLTAAYEKYEAALATLRKVCDLVSRGFYVHYYEDMALAFVLKVRICLQLAATSLRLGIYEEACSWADLAMDPEGTRYGVSLSVADRGKALFCKAQALESMGQSSQAGVAMAEAVRCDNSDG